MKSLFGILSLFTFVSFSFGATWNTKSDFQIWYGKDISVKLSSLPVSARLMQKVWSGDHWPYTKGGTARVDPVSGLSPLQKLEEVSTLARGAHEWEVNTVSNNKGIGWGGHCNGLAIAGSLHPEPTKEVIYLGQTFQPNDIKALLIEVYQGPMPILGERCRDKSLGDRSCKDLNAATFHLSLTNVLGIENRVIVFDIKNGPVVFNYPILAYDMSILEVSLEEAQNLLNLKNNRAYANNSQARHFVKVFAEIQTTVILGDEKPLKYEYLLELDADKNVIGGEWLNGSLTDHPDFLWIPQSSPKLENPYVDPWTVLEIARLSY